MSKEEEKEVWRKKQNEYYSKNRDAWNEYQKEYKRRKYAEDPEYKLRMKEYQRERRLTKKREDNA